MEKPQQYHAPDMNKTLFDGEYHAPDMNETLSYDENDE